MHAFRPLLGISVWNENEEMKHRYAFNIPFNNFDILSDPLCMVGRDNARYDKTAFIIGTTQKNTTLFWLLQN